MNIAIDVFGGDHAPQEILAGCVEALHRFNDIHLILSGDEEKIKETLSRFSYDAKRVEILHAPEIITCEESPTLAVKRKKESSLVKAMEAVRDGKADCIVSAGSTGAILAGATLIVRRIKDVKRPALGVVMPCAKGCVMIMDCGANVDCKPSYLQQFSVMASAYMKKVLEIDSPRIGLLNNGAEEGKGNELTKAAYRRLKEAPINFVGNCEARDVLSGDYDAVICDGFDGNVILKYTEGIAVTFMGMLKKELLADGRSKMGAILAKPAFKRFKKTMDYTEYGGAPLLGIDGGVIKAHGSSDAKAIASAIGQARSYVKGDVTQTIRETIAALPEIED